MKNYEINYNNGLAVTNRRSFIFLMAGTAAIAITGCNPAKLKTNATEVPQLVISVLSDPKTFNYPLSQESPNVFGYIYEGLISENGYGQIEPALAESWQVSEDKKRIIFTLRKGLQWSDAQPLTADDVVFTYQEIYLNEAIPTDARDVLRIGESRALPTIRKIDDRTIEFTTPEPFAPFLRVTGLPILPAHILRESVQTKDSQGKPKFLSMWGIDTPLDQIIVNGPYKLSSYATSQRVVFDRNPYYWRKDANGNPLPYIQRLIWQIVESTDTALVQFRSGGLDGISVSPDYFSLLKREEKRSDFTIYNGGPASGTTFISFNLNKGSRNGRPLVNPIKARWFQMKEFRQAVAYAIDRQTTINNTFRGLGELQNSPISVQSPYYLKPEEGLKTYNYDPEKAKEILIAAGFKYNERGQLLDDDGNRVRFSLITNAGNKIREAMGAQIKQDLGKIGMQVDFNPVAWSAITDKLTNSLDWECHLLGFTGGVEPNDGANIWSSKGGLHSFNQGPQEGTSPIQGWQTYEWEKEVDRLMIEGAKELDDAKRKVIYARYQNIVQEQLPLIYLVNPLSMGAVKNQIEDVKYTALGGAFWNLYELKIGEQKLME